MVIFYEHRHPRADALHGLFPLRARILHGAPFRVRRLRHFRAARLLPRELPAPSAASTMATRELLRMTTRVDSLRPAGKGELLVLSDFSDGIALRRTNSFVSIHRRA
jgi:hypothetical protein